MSPQTALGQILVARHFACPTNWRASCWGLGQLEGLWPFIQQPTCLRVLAICLYWFFVWLKLERGYSIDNLGNKEQDVGQGYILIKLHTMGVPVNSTLTPMAFLLLFLSYLAKSFSITPICPARMWWQLPLPKQHYLPGQNKRTYHHRRLSSAFHATHRLDVFSQSSSSNSLYPIPTLSLVQETLRL